ncbi:MAG: transglutaminase-like domain-containing protein [Myxococcales bacterium]|nr:transglutaminase-like domain-containing protein [Myxococcales bacterium]MDH3484533.1 transglutaminase-like domain-containing protein [Myxococcales bacterium]
MTTRATSASLVVGALTEAGRAAIHGLAWAVLAATMAPPAAALAAFGGGFIGSVLGATLARTRLRTSVVVLGAIVAIGLVVWLRWALIGGSTLAAVIGPIGAMRASAILTALLCPAIVSVTLRTSSSRRAIFAVLELLLVAVAFTQLFIPHRNGAINRPFYLADWIIALGWDPTWLFLFMGGAATVFGLVLLLQEQRFGRALLNLGVVGLLLALIVIATPMVGMPPPPPGGGGLGLRPNEAQGKKEDKGQKQQQQGPSNSELEFRNKYSAGGARVPVAVVLFHDDYSPPSGVYYFRQGAFSQYNGRKLVTSGRRDVDRDLIPHFPTRPFEITDAPPTNENRGPLETTIALMADHTQPFALEAPVEVEPMQNPYPNRFRRVYRAISGVLTSDYAAMLDGELGSPKWSKDQWAHYTETPPDPRYEELAAEIASEVPQELADSQVARAFSVASWLGREGIYSLKNEHSGAEDPTASFLFGDLTGYCVHFAHAATYLLRSLGVPARVATGYAVSESARQGGSSLLLSGAASHAWPEIYIDGFGWVVLDVYPERALDPPEQPMDADLQRLLGELARGASPLPLSATDLPKIRELARRVTMTIGTWLLMFVVAVLIFLFGVKGWRRFAPEWSSTAALSRVVYRAELDRIGEVSVLRAPGESRESFATRIRDQMPAFERLTRAHIASAFGRHEPDSSSLREDALDVRREIRQRFPAWKRFLGFITPWSWLRSK